MYIPPTHTTPGWLLTQHDVSTIRIESTAIGGYGWGRVTSSGICFTPIDGLHGRSDAQIPEYVKHVVREHFREEE